MSSRTAEEFGPYLVYEQIGIGGMASVHRAEQHGIEGFRKPVALKRMLPHVAGDATLVKSFVREARLASHLRHVNVAQTYELGRVGEIYFIAMELVQGRTLREILKHSGKVTGPMPVPIALNLLNQLCDALDYAHNLCDETGAPLGIIHRDVSPSNIIVSEGSGVAKLIDFGIAKVRNSGMQTMSGIVKGKFSYMAPEYIEGQLDARADLFAVGVIAHELLTNQSLFAGRDDMDTLTRVKNMRIEPPSTINPAVPPEVDMIVMTALERDPERRWQQATALRTAMTTVTRRLGLNATNQQVVEWVEWAFAQKRDDSDPEISISRGTVPAALLGAGSNPEREMQPPQSGPLTKVEIPVDDNIPTLPPALPSASHSATTPRGSQPRPSARPSQQVPNERTSQQHQIPKRPSQPQPVQYYRPTQPQPLSHHPDRPPLPAAANAKTIGPSHGVALPAHVPSHSGQWSEDSIATQPFSEPLPTNPTLDMAKTLPRISERRAAVRTSGLREAEVGSADTSALTTPSVPITSDQVRQAADDLESVHPEGTGTTTGRNTTLLVLLIVLAATAAAAVVYFALPYFS